MVPFWQMGNTLVRMLYDFLKAVNGFHFGNS